MWSAQQSQLHPKKKHIGGTCGFVAPELLSADNDSFFFHLNNFACDMWSVGMTVVCFLVRRSWFFEHDSLADSVRSDRDIELKEIKCKVTKHNITQLMKEQWSVDELTQIEQLGVLHVLFQCLEFDPVVRITASNALKLLNAKFK